MIVFTFYIIINTCTIKIIILLLLLLLLLNILHFQLILCVVFLLVFMTFENNFRKWAWLNSCALHWLMKFQFRSQFPTFWQITCQRFLNERHIPDKLLEVAITRTHEDAILYRTIQGKFTWFIWFLRYGLTVNFDLWWRPSLKFRFTLSIFNYHSCTVCFSIASHTCEQRIWTAYFW